MSNDYSPTVYNKAFEVKYRHKNLAFKLIPYSPGNQHVLKFVDPSEEAKIIPKPTTTTPDVITIPDNPRTFLRESAIYTDYITNRLTELRSIVTNRVQNELSRTRNLVWDRAINIEQEFNRTQQQLDNILAGIRDRTRNLAPEILEQAGNELALNRYGNDGNENLENENSTETIQHHRDDNAINSNDIPVSRSNNVDNSRHTIQSIDDLFNQQAENESNLPENTSNEQNDTLADTIESTIQFPITHQTQNNSQAQESVTTSWTNSIQENLSTINISSDSSRTSTSDSSSSSSTSTATFISFSSDSDESDILEDSGIGNYRYNSDSIDLYQWTRSSRSLYRRSNMLSRAWDERVRQNDNNLIDRNVRFLDNIRDEIENDDIMTSGMFKILTMRKINKRQSQLKSKMQKQKPAKININATSIPEPRSGHQLVNDGKYIYLFGGYDSTINAEGIYNLHETESRTTRISDRRSGIRRSRNEMSPRNVVHNIYTEIFRFSLEDKTWDRLPEHVPIGSASGTLHIIQSPKQAYSNSSNTFLYIGGTTYSFDQASRTIFTLEIPKEIDEYKVCKIAYLKAPTYLHSSVLVKKYNCLFILGGIQVLRSGEMDFKPKLFKMDLRTKEIVKIDENFDDVDWLNNCGKSFLKSVLVHFKDKLYIFGSCNSTTHRISENNSKVLFTYNILENKWGKEFLNPDPKFGYPEARNRFAYSIYKEKFIYISGGESVHNDVLQRPKLLDSVWRIDLEDMCWKFICKLPFGITFHASTITLDGKLYLFGGKTINRINDTDVKFNSDGSEILLRSNKMFVINLEIPSLKFIAGAVVDLMDYNKKVENILENSEAENGA